MDRKQVCYMYLVFQCHFLLMNFIHVHFQYTCTCLCQIRNMLAFLRTKFSYHAQNYTNYFHIRYIQLIYQNNLFHVIIKCVIKNMYNLNFVLIEQDTNLWMDSEP